MNYFIKALIILTIFFVGCDRGPVGRISAAIDASDNTVKMQNIQLGQSTAQVKAIMGEPRKTEAFMSQGKDIHVWYYVTQSMAPFRGLEDWNYTPLVFEKDVLAGWGQAYLGKVTK